MEIAMEMEIEINRNTKKVHCGYFIEIKFLIIYLYCHYCTTTLTVELVKFYGQVLMGYDIIYLQNLGN